MIAADQNSRTDGKLVLDAVEKRGCSGCHYHIDGEPCGPGSAGNSACTPTRRTDRRSIIWVARDFTANPATVAADILRAQGEDVDAASVKRAEAVCEEPAPTPCCGNFESCTRACTPRGAYLQERGLPLHPSVDKPTPAGLVAAPWPRDQPTHGDFKPGSEFADEPPIFTDWADAFSIVFDDPAYASLGRVLTRAYAQAATGKGAERHGQGQPFERQPMQDLIRLHGVGFATGQAGKKSQEALRLPRERAVAELLGAINYLAGAVIAIEAGDTHHQP